jgi:hypothetical protein
VSGEFLIMRDITLLKSLLQKYVKLNKEIINTYAIAVVPSKRTGKLPINDLDIEEDFIFFCFTKFTKTMLAIESLISKDLNEDALILTRSNYECFINAKSVIKTSGMIDHLVEYKLGLVNEKRYKKKSRNQIISKDSEGAFKYISSVWEIAKSANEESTYNYVYSFLCEITHLNMLTSGYYRKGIEYSYSLSSKIAKYNALLWNVYLNIKFYYTLIESEIIEDEEYNESLAGMLITDTIKLQKVFETEIKRIEQETDMNDEYVKYIDILKNLFRKIGE